MAARKLGLDEVLERLDGVTGGLLVMTVTLKEKASKATCQRLRATTQKNLLVLQ